MMLACFMFINHISYNIAKNKAFFSGGRVIMPHLQDLNFGMYLKDPVNKRSVSFYLFQKLN